jgi:hypothetical protein
MGIKLRNEIAALVDAAHGLELAIRGLRALRTHPKVGDAYYGALENQAVELRRRLEKLAAELDSADRAVAVCRCAAAPLRDIPAQKPGHITAIRA